MKLLLTMWFIFSCSIVSHAQQGEDMPDRIEQLKSERANLVNRLTEIDKALAQVDQSKGKDISIKISMTSIPVVDPIKAFKFYTEVLGFVEVMYQPDMQIAIVASPEQPDGTSLLLEPMGETFYKTFQEAVYSQDMPIIIFGVEDIQSKYELLKERGVKFKSEPTTSDYGTSAIFDDTCGNYIQLHQPL
jgi:predicted enzyme related to lactoylglutathione lyase